MRVIIPFFLLAVRASSFFQPVKLGPRKIYQIQRGIELKATYTDEDFDKLVNLMISPVISDAMKKAGKSKVEEDVDAEQRLSQNVKPIAPLGFESSSKITDRNLPTPEMTGVDPAIVQICATLCAKNFCATTVDDLKFKPPGRESIEILFYDTHTPLDVSIPPFVIAITEKTMILNWRASKTIFDWLSNYSASPVASSRWGDLAGHIKVHSGYCSLVENDLAVHEIDIIREIKSRKITELIVTGHSLGGGMAQVAQLFLQSSLNKDTSPWSEIKGVSLRCIAFSAPMPILELDTNNAKAKSFLKELHENSCNIVYSSDPVPRIPGNVVFTNDFITDIIPVIVDKIINGTPFSTLPILKVLPFLYLKMQLEEAYAKTKNKQPIKNVISVLVRYQDLGKIIFYGPERFPKPELKSDEEFLKIKYIKGTDIWYVHNFLVLYPGGLAYDNEVI